MFCTLESPHIRKAVYAGMRMAVIDNAIGNGKSAEEARALADKYDFDKEYFEFMNSLQLNLRR